MTEAGLSLTPRFLPAGETALVVEFGQVIDPFIHDHVLALDAALAGAPLDGIVETVPTYRSLLIHFEPRLLTTEDLIAHLAAMMPLQRLARGMGRLWRIPVCYDAALAEDIEEVATQTGLAAAEVAALHADTRYRVYMYGFAPGFTFLGGLPEKLGISRRPTPRPPAPPGSLLIAGGQALISTIAMPTGWYVVGQTPVKMFDPKREPAFFVEAGDEITFEPINRAAYDDLSVRQNFMPSCESLTE